MKYYLLANNIDIQDSHIDQIELKDNILILFNYMIPMKFDKIKTYSKKYLFCRIIANVDKVSNIEAQYAGLGMGYDLIEYFQKIFLYPYPEDSRLYSNLQLNHTIFSSIDEKVADLKKISRYPKYKNMSTGFIVYNYICDIKNINDEIILVGFNSDINKNYHHPNWEAKFFRDQVQKKKCRIIW